MKSNRSLTMKLFTAALTTIALAAALALPAAAADPRPFSLGELMSLKVPHALTVSPGGDRVAFALTEPDFEAGTWRTTLWLAFADGRPPRQLTRGEDDDQPSWSPDGSSLAFVSRRAGAGEASGPAQVWILPMAGGEPYRATSLGGDLVAWRWMPDGRSLVVVERDPLPAARHAEEDLRERRKADVHVEGDALRPCRILRVDLDASSVRTLLVGDPGIADVAVSPDGSTLTYASNGTGREDSDDAYNFWLFRQEGGTTPQRLTAFRSERARRLPGRSYDTDGFRGVMAPRWSPDGRFLAGMEHVDGSVDFSRCDIHLLSPDGKRDRNLTGPCDRFVEAYDWRGRTMVFWACDGVDRRLYRADPGSGRVAPLTAGAGCWGAPALSADGARVAGVFEDATHGPEVRVFPVDHPAAALTVTHFNDAVESWRLAPMEAFHWKSDGMALEGVLVKPPGFDPARRYPLLVLPHGGPLGVSSLCLRHHLAWQWLAEQGYLVFAPNFRGSEGYGNAFAVADRGDLGGGDYRDVMSGVDALIGRGFVDPARMGVFGGSYGGYMTNWIIGHTHRFKAAVSMYGIFSLVTDFSNSNIPSFESDYLGDYYWESPGLYARESPSTYVASMQTPVLILQGEADVNTDMANSREMYTALRKLKQTATLVTYPREGHGIDGEPNHARDVVTRLAGWFDRWLKRGGEPAAARGWSARLVSTHEVGSYAGQEPTRGRFIEVTVALECPAGASPELSLAVADVRLDGGGAAYAPAGVPQETLGNSVLVRGNGMRVEAAGSAMGRGRDVPVSLCFDVPDGVTEWTLRLPGFAPMRLEVDGD